MNPALCHGDGGLGHHEPCGLAGVGEGVVPCTGGEPRARCGLQGVGTGGQGLGDRCARGHLGAGDGAGDGRSCGPGVGAGEAGRRGTVGLGSGDCGDGDGGLGDHEPCGLGGVSEGVALCGGCEPRTGCGLQGVGPRRQAAGDRRCARGHLGAGDRAGDGRPCGLGVGAREAGRRRAVRLGPADARDGDPERGHQIGRFGVPGVCAPPAGRLPCGLEPAGEVGGSSVSSGTHLGEGARRHHGIPFDCASPAGRLPCGLDPAGELVAPAHLGEGARGRVVVALRCASPAGRLPCRLDAARELVAGAQLGEGSRGRKASPPLCAPSRSPALWS